MSILVVGVANTQTTVPIGSFPVSYEPARYLPGQIIQRVGGVGFNVARALAALGNQVRLVAPLGDDVGAAAVREQAARCRIDLVPACPVADTPRSVVLVDNHGQRQIHTDLRDALTATLDLQAVCAQLPKIRVVVAANLDLCRPLLPLCAEYGVKLAVDLQDVQGSDNPYDTDFVTHADLLTMSDARLAQEPRPVLEAMHRQGRAELLVLGQGARGALALIPHQHKCRQIPAFPARARDTTGAGDAFMAALVHYLYVNGGDPEQALTKASAFTAGYLEQGVNGGGYPDQGQVEAILRGRGTGDLEN